MIVSLDFKNSPRYSKEQINATRKTGNILTEFVQDKKTKARIGAKRNKIKKIVLRLSRHDAEFHCFELRELQRKRKNINSEMLSRVSLLVLSWNWQRYTMVKLKTRVFYSFSLYVLEFLKKLKAFTVRINEINSQRCVSFSWKTAQS